MDQGLLGFATLLIGLATGRQPVELLVSRPVASVRLLLDGREVAGLTQPPWRAVFDLGSGPIPHRIEVIGLSSTGVEIARAVQWANLPRPEVDLDLVLERNDSGKVVGARFAWVSARPEAAPALRAALDGRPLGVRTTDRVTFPAMDEERAHLLRVEAEFTNGGHASKEIAFGGPYSDVAASALTAIPAVLQGPGKPVLVDEVAATGADAQPLQVVAIENASARVAVVIDRRAVQSLSRAVWAKRVCSWPARPGSDDVLLVDPVPEQFRRDDQRSSLFTAQLAPRSRVRDLPEILSHSALTTGALPDQELTNALANAALLAAVGGRRRAVVLIIGASEGGGGELSIQDVREYLRVLGVPLRIWTPVAAVATQGAPGWGAVEDVSTCALLNRASEKLDDELEQQRIVWVQGLHLPQEVVLTSSRLIRLR